MEITKQVKSLESTSLNKLFAKFSFLVLCLRGYFSGILGDTLIITLFLNFIIALSINYRSVRKSFFIFASLSILTVYNRDVLALIDILAIIYCLRGCKISFLFRINACVLFFYVLTWFILLGLGFLRDQLMIMPKGIAHCMGYENSNQFGMLSFYIVSSLFLITSKKWRIASLLLIPLVNETFFNLSIARTPWIGCYVLLLVSILSYTNIIRRSFRFFIGLLPVFIFIALVYLAIHISQYPELDLVFTTRFSNYANLLSNFSVINWIIGFPQRNGIIIDSSYFMILCSGGAACVVYFWWKYFDAIVNRWEALYQYLPFIISMLAIGIGENIFSSANALSLIFWFLIFNYKQSYK